MTIRRSFLGALLTLACLPAFAQDAKSVLASASKAMGLDGVTSLYYYGSGASYTLGQNNNANIPWPKTPLNDYVRAIDFSVPGTRATWSTYAQTVQGGAAVLAPAQQNITPTTAWTQQLDLWTSPWGFIKGAEANGATLSNKRVGGTRYQVLTWNSPFKSPGGQPYRVVGYIKDGLVERTETWLDHPVFGDMLVESEFKFYRSNNGLMYPTEIVQKRAGWPVFDLNVLAAFANPAKLKQLMTSTAPAPGAPPAAAAAAPAAASTKLADGVYQIRGAYNSLAVEFADHVLLIEPGPMNEARALAGIAETKRLFPTKPIRYGVPTHHHIDHTGGIAAVAAEGITIVTPEVNKAFFESVLKAPRTLSPDSLSKSGKKPMVEGFKGDKRVFQDATRTVEIHVIQGLPHADGLVVAWLPKEKLLVYADMFNFPPADKPVPDPPVVGTRVFLENIERLKLDPVSILSIHTMNPDRLVTMEDIRKTVFRN